VDSTVVEHLRKAEQHSIGSLLEQQKDNQLTLISGKKNKQNSETAIAHAQNVYLRNVLYSLSLYLLDLKRSGKFENEDKQC
jgi:hypothetical protein